MYWLVDIYSHQDKKHIMRLDDWVLVINPFDFSQQYPHGILHSDCVWYMDH